MRKTALAIAAIAALVGTPAPAADMAVKAPPKPVPPPLPLWTGFYLGVNGGCGWSKSPTPNNYAVDGAEDAGVFTSETGTGCFGGGQIGYNYQLATNFVLGLEIDAAWANIGSSFLWNQGNGDDINNWSSKLDSFGTVRARLGYAYDRWLPYVTGGWAWGHNKITVTCPVSCDNFGDPATSINSQTHYGWVLGAGLEYALAPNWSVKVEYLHLALSSKRYNVQVDFDNGVPAGFNSGHLNVDTVKLGLNYRTNWWR